MITDIKVSFSRVANGEGTVSCFSTTRTVLERRSHAGWSIINNHHFHLLFSRLQEHFRHIDLNTMQPQSNRISLSEFLHMRMTLIICQTANPTASMGMLQDWATKKAKRAESDGYRLCRAIPAATTTCQQS
jgi:hypothetical protein